MIVIINNHTKANSKNVCGSLTYTLIKFLKLTKTRYKVLNNSIESNNYIKRYNKNIKGFIFSGSSKSINEVNLDDLVTMNYIVFNFNKPIIGICFGHQYLAKIHGSTINSFRNIFSGQRLTNIKPFTLLPYKASYDLTYHHFDYVKNAPHCFIVISKTNNIITLIEHKYRPIFGTQFHLDHKNMNYESFNIYFNFLKLCDEKHKKEFDLNELYNFTKKKEYKIDDI